MLKNKKITLFLVIFLIITFITTITFADDENTTQATEATAETDSSENSSENMQTSETNQDIHEGDLYLSGTDITMDKLVNGNVYIMGETVNVTGQVAGNLFILANKVNFTDAYIESSTYICANEVYFQAVTSDLYIAANSLEIPSDYGVYRDIKCTANSLTLLGIVGRNADCAVKTLLLEKDETKASIYGNLNYASPFEVNIPEGSVEGEVNYNKTEEITEDKAFNISEYIIKACQAIIFTLAIYGLALLFTKNSIEKCTKITKKKFLPAFGIGLLALIAVPIASIILLITIIGLPLAFALLVTYGLLLAISTSVFSISISNIVCDKAKISNKWLKALCVAVASLLVCIIGLIPYVSILKALIVILGFGTIIMNIFFKNIQFEKEAK